MLNPLQQGEQTGKMLEGIEEILMTEKPDALLVYGDTNSTLAGAIAAVKMHIPVIHIESGLRSFNKAMPEEINRIVADHSSSLLFTPTHAGVVNLQNEGFEIARKAPFSAEKPGVFHCGDIMLDNSLYFAGKVNGHTLDKFDLKKDSYFLTTIHRPQNTDNAERLVTIMETLMEIATAQELDMVIPLHPRTNKVLTEQHNALWNSLLEHPRVQILPPASFLEMIDLENNSRFVVTDSGGVQKEAYFFRKPCLILRGETEWVEICEVNQAKLVDADSEKIKAGVEWIYSAKNQDFPPIFGDGKASEFICEQILAFLHQG
jgi:UDP-GlcNAc3NAcA epimerase